MELSFTELLHENRELRKETSQKLWNFILEHSDDIDVENMRDSIGLTNTPKDIYKIISRLQFLTKSKLTSFGFDAKKFQFYYIFGVSGEDTEATRKGSNLHLVSELIPNCIESNKIIDEFTKNKSIVNYIEKICNEVFIDTISNATGSDIDTLEKSLSIFSKDESEIYINGMHNIAIDYDNRLKSLSFLNIEESVNYLIPEWMEICIWDLDNWNSGIVDAIYKHPYDGRYPVDYKFGAKKDRRYEPSIALELTFYKNLISCKNGVYAHEYTGDQKPWIPIYAKYGEMWHMFDDNKAKRIEFSSKWNKAYYHDVSVYWDAMNKMDYDFQRYYGYMNDRYLDFCTGGKFQCELYKLCRHSKSFRAVNDDDGFIAKMVNNIEP